MAAEALSARERHRLEIEARDGLRCGLRALGGCSGPLQADHPLKVQALIHWRDDLRIRARRSGGRLTLGQERFAMLTDEEIIADARNGWLLCQHGHHAPKDGKRLVGWERYLPDEFWGWLDRFDLEPVLERSVRGANHAPGHGSATPRRYGRRPRDPRA